MLLLKTIYNLYTLSFLLFLWEMGYFCHLPQESLKKWRMLRVNSERKLFRNNPNGSQSPEFLMDYHTSQSSGVCSDKSLYIFIDNKELILNKKVMGKVDPS